MSSLRQSVREERPKTIEAVYQKWNEHLGILRRIQQRDGDSMNDYATVQLACVEEWIVDCSLALWGSDGHGRPLGPPARLIIKRRRTPWPGQLRLFEMEVAA